MKTLTVEARLGFTLAAVAVTRALGLLNQSMKHADFATAIGMRAHGEPSRPWHRQHIARILQTAAAAEKQKDELASPLRFDLIIGEEGAHPIPELHSKPSPL